MKLIKVLFLFVFITSVNSYVSQTTYEYSETQLDINLTGDLYIAPISCKDSTDGRFKIQDVFGQAPFTYRWEDQNGINVRTTNTNNNSDSLTEADIPGGLTTGAYYLEVSDDNGEVLDFFPSLIDPNRLTFRTMGTGGTSLKDPSCNFGPLSADGEIISRAVGGTSPLSYLWDDPFSTNNRRVSNLAPGIYSVIVTDDNGCKDTAEYELFQPSLVVANASIAVSGCQGSDNTQLISTPSGGTGQYTFTWLTDGAPPIQIDQLTVAAPSHQTIDVDNSSSVPMDYILQVVDDNGCTTNPPNFAIQSNIPTPHTIDVGTDPFPSFCEGIPSDAMGGSFGGSATSGVWSGGVAANWTNPNDPLNATYTPSAGEASPITVTLTSNGGGCPQVSGQKTLAWTSTPTVTGTLDACIGSTTQLTGSAPLGGSTWSSATLGVATVDATGLVSGVSAGTSVITYTDGNGCFVDETVTINAFPTVTGTLDACIGSTTQLTGSAPLGGSTWSSATLGVATVDATGLVSGVSAGTSVITLTT
ncbi:hypothetical protein N9X23_02695 [Flavobacteriales bacterium]|nr:hypothetical protein [Flavobacteriales bacterium]